MADVLLTVRRLITLAVNAGANEHEARNAALKACRMLHEGGFLDRLQTPAPPPAPPPKKKKKEPPVAPPPPPVHASWPTSNGTNIRDFMDEFMRSAQAYPPGFGQGPRPPPPQPSVADSPPKRPYDPAAQNVLISVVAYCHDCGYKLPIGSYGTSSRGELWHRDCYAAVVGEPLK